MSNTEREENQPQNDTDLLLPNGKPKALSPGISFTKSDCIILGIWTVVPATLVAVVWLALHVLSDGVQENWLTHLALNLLGYLTVFLPGYATIRYLREKNYEESARETLLYAIVKPIFFGGGESDGEQKEEDPVDIEAVKCPGKQREVACLKNDLIIKAMKLLLCLVGLLASFLTWGVLQEKIITQQYVDSSGKTGRFKDSEFLVLVNRIVGFTVSLAYLILCPIQQPRHRVPLYKYSFSSLSNIMSSWFQYESLKFVSFPTQVLAKATKIIPVMIMGKIVSGLKYKSYEYVVAVLISVGMALFLFGSQADNADSSRSTQVIGVLLLLGYLTFDAFNNTYQNKLFSAHKMSSVQMMCGVNFFSVILTATSQLQQDAILTSLAFMLQFPAFAFDCFLHSLCSAVGGLFIFYTISEFGAVVFVIISTLRQMMAIVISTLLYGHTITAIGILGILLVFGAIYLKVFCGLRTKKLKKSKSLAECNSDKE